MRPLALFDSKFGTLYNNLRFYRYVSPNKELRDKAIAIQKQIDEWSIKSSMRLDVYQALAEYREVSKAGGEWDTLTAEQ